MSRLRRASTAALLAQMVLSPLAANAQDDATKDPNSKVIPYKQDPTNPSAFSFDYGPTQTPALNLIGVSASKATLYTGGAPFALAVPSVLDGSGQQAIGIDVAPAWALQSRWPILKSTYDDPSQVLARIWYRTRFEFAATNGATSATASKIQASGMAIGVASSLLGWSDPVTVKRKGSKRDYFDECVAPDKNTVPPPTLPTLQDKILATLKQLNQQYIVHGDLNTLIEDLQYIRQKSTNDPLSKAHMARDIPFYRALKPAENLPPIPAALAASSTAPVPEDQALADFKALFQDLTTTGPTPEARQKAQDAVDELQGLANDRSALAKAPSTSTAQRQTNVANYLDSLQSVDPWARELRRLGLIDQALQASAASGANQPQQSDIDKFFTDKLATKDTIEALIALQKVADKKVDTVVAVRAFQDADITKGFATCIKAASLMATAAPDVSAGLGYVEAGNPGTLSHLHSGGETVWLAGRFPLINNLEKLSPEEIAGDSAKAWYVMGGGSVTYQHQALLTTGDSTTPLAAANVTGVWLGLEGFGPSYRGAVQVGYTDSRTDISKFATAGYRWELFGSYKIWSGTWLGLAYGTARGNTTKLDDHTAMVTLQFTSPSASGLFGKADSGDLPSH